MNLVLPTPKKLWSFFVVLTLVSAMAPVSVVRAADGEGDVSPAVQEAVIEFGTSEITATTAEVNGVEIEGVSEAIETANHELVFESGDGRKFTFQGAPPTSISAQKYSQFSFEERAKFQKIRVWCLSKAIKILGRSDMTWGVTSLIGRPVAKAIGKTVRATVKATKYTLYNLTLRKFKKLNPFNEIAIASVPAERRTPKNLRDRGNMALTETLTSIDKALWNAAYEMVKHNQFVIKASIGFIGQGGKFGNVRGGVKSYALRIGYDVDRKRVVMDVLPEAEVLKFAIFCPISLGFIPKVGIASYASTPEGKCITSSTFYTPGAPFYATHGSDFSEAGFSMSLAAFPQGIGEFYTYKSTFTTSVPRADRTAREAVREIGADARETVSKISNSIAELARKIEERDRRDAFEYRAQSVCEKRMMNRPRYDDLD